MASKGWGIWWVSAIPARQRACGGRDVMSRPSSRTAPRSGRRRPIMTLRAVVLPAPLGPMTPRASPSWMASESPSRTRRDPKALVTPSSSSSAGLEPAATSLSGRKRAELAGGGNTGRRPVAHDRHVEAKVLAAPPLPADQRGLADVGHRPLGPAHRAHDRVEVGGLDGGDDGAPVVDTGRSLEHVQPDFEQGVDEPQRLGPLLLR